VHDGPPAAVYNAAMITVVIPALNAEATLPACLESLFEAAMSGLVRQVIVVDGGSTDRTAEVADRAGAEMIASPRGRGTQLAAGAAAARHPWLLFLHADTALEPGWEQATRRFIAESQGAQAAAFTFALDDASRPARRMTWLVALRCRLFALPYGDQGLLIARDLYESLGGYRPHPLMEDVDLVRRIGRRRLVMLKPRAVTSGERYRREGWWSRPIRNLTLLALFFLGVSPRRLAIWYGYRASAAGPDTVPARHAPPAP